MTKAQTGIVVLRDATGSYFFIPQETLERGRVPEEHKAELERLLAVAADDVQGHRVLQTPPPARVWVGNVSDQVNNDGTAAGIGRLAQGMGMALDLWAHGV